jgi:hypothetical protein
LSSNSIETQTKPITNSRDETYIKNEIEREWSEHLQIVNVWSGSELHAGQEKEKEWREVSHQPKRNRIAEN